MKHQNYSQHFESTRKYPRTLNEAFPMNVEAIEKRKQWMWFEAHGDWTTPDVEFWTYITLAFAAGFLTHILFGAA
jgi:hypothetical protein